MSFSTWSLAFMASVAAVGSACKGRAEIEPSPLGTFGSDELADWAPDCTTPLVDEPVCGSLAPQVDCAARFHTVDPRSDWVSQDAPWATTATRRITCKPPGWSLWTDDRGRVIAICADWTPGQPPLDPTLRLRDLITEHWNAKTWDAIFRVIDGEDTKHNVVWWAWRQPMVPRVIPQSSGPPQVVPTDPKDLRETSCVEFRLHR